MSYDVHEFGWMLTDQVRRDAFTRAVLQNVTPHTRMLDLGAGTGHFTMLALDAGAAHVTAVDPADAIVDLPDALHDAGYADRASVYQGDARNMPTAEFDLILSDMRGQTGLLRDGLEVLGDAHRRLLAPGGLLIPRREQLFVALVSDADKYQADSEPWGYLGPGRFAGSERRSLSTATARNIRPANVVSTSEVWGEIDYHDLADNSPRLVSGSVKLEVEREHAGVHGLVVWFSVELCDGVSFDTAPSDANPAYNRRFLPFREPALIEPGTEVDVRVSASSIAGSWLWDWSLQAGEIHRQTSTLDEAPLPEDDLVEAAPEDLRRDAILLGLMADGQSPSEAARTASESGEFGDEDLARHAATLREAATGNRCRRLL